MKKLSGPFYSILNKNYEIENSHLGAILYIFSKISLNDRWDWQPMVLMDSTKNYDSWEAEKKRAWNNHLKIPSGSEGAWHHEGEFSGTLPLEDILHSCKSELGLEIYQLDVYSIKMWFWKIPSSFYRQVLYRDDQHQGHNDQSYQQNCRQVQGLPWRNISPIVIAKYIRKTIESPFGFIDVSNYW